MAPPAPLLPSEPLPLEKSPQPAAAFVLPATPASVAVARRNVRALLRAWGLRDEVCDDALLVVSELVTNAIRYACGDEIMCTLRCSAPLLRIEVEDQIRGRTSPTRMCPSPDDQSGRGLLLVGGMSTDWGVRETAGGTGHVVWADLPTQEQQELRPETEPAEAREHATTHARPDLPTTHACPDMPTTHARPDMPTTHARPDLPMVMPTVHARADTPVAETRPAAPLEPVARSAAGSVCAVPAPVSRVARPVGGLATGFRPTAVEGAVSHAHR